MGRPLAVFLGAGFSAWAANLPVAANLFDFKITVFGPQEARRLRAIELLKNAWDVEHPGSDSELFIAEQILGAESAKEKVLWYICRRLSEPFIWKERHAGRERRHVLMIDENRKHLIEGVAKASEFLLRMNNPYLEGIITTNYDLLAEYALGTKLFNYGIIP